MLGMDQKPSNPKRGENYRHWARHFYDAVEIPCVLTSRELDAILSRLDPEYDPRNWGQHRRGVCVGHLRDAARHSDMNSGRFRAYTIRWIGKDQWQVSWVQDELAEGRILGQLDKAIANAERNHKYLAESLPAGTLPDWQRSQLLQSSEFTLRTLKMCRTSTCDGIEALQKLNEAFRMLELLPGIPGDDAPEDLEE